MSTLGARRTPAERLLDVAGELFVSDGIRAVGIDRLLAEAGVAKASLYQSFGSKDALVVAYLARQHTEDRRAFERAADHVSGARARVLLPFDLAAAKVARRDFRGCLYLNAATEFPGPQSPVAAVVAEHREWLADVWRGALTELGHPDPTGATDRVVVLYDGGLAGTKAARSAEPLGTARAMVEDLVGPGAP